MCLPWSRQRLRRDLPTPILKVISSSGFAGKRARPGTTAGITPAPTSSAFADRAPSRSGDVAVRTNRRIAGAARGGDRSRCAAAPKVAPMPSRATARLMNSEPTPRAAPSAPRAWPRQRAQSAISLTSWSDSRAFRPRACKPDAWKHPNCATTQLWPISVPTRSLGGR